MTLGQDNDINVFGNLGLRCGICINGVIVIATAIFDQLCISFISGIFGCPTDNDRFYESLESSMTADSLGALGIERYSIRGRRCSQSRRWKIRKFLNVITGSQVSRPLSSRQGEADFKSFMANSSTSILGSISEIDTSLIGLARERRLRNQRT